MSQRLKKTSRIVTPKNKQHNSFYSKPFFLLSLLIIVTALVFVNSLNNGFTNWDDHIYLAENQYIKDLSCQGLKNIFSTPYFSNYHPLTTLSYAIEYKFFGLENPKIFHFTNLLFHLLNTILVFIFIKHLSKNISRSFITAVLFALHPMHVESVAWISERKDVMYAFFYLASLIFYVKYLLSEQKNLKYLFLCFILFVASLLSKSAAVTLPLAMLLLNFYIFKKFQLKELLKTLPFFALSLLFGIIALKTQEASIIDLRQLYSFGERILLVFYALFFYIFRFVLPYNFSPLHPFQSIGFNAESLPYFIAPMVIVALTIALIFAKRNLRHELIFGLLFFLLNVVLIIQIVSVGMAVVAERYTYIPYIGLSYIVAVAYVRFSNNNNKKWLLVFGLLYVGFLSASTWQQTKVWKDSNTLWSKALSIYPSNAVALNNRGNAKNEAQDYAGAIEDCSMAIESDPTYATAYFNRAYAYKELNQTNEALQDYNSAILLDTNFTDAYNNRGRLKMKLNSYEEAISDFTKAAEIHPSNPNPYINRGLTYAHLSKHQEAQHDFEKALTLNPNSSKAYYNRGIFKGRHLNDIDGAITDFNRAIELQHDYAEAYCDRGIAFSIKGLPDKALNDYKKAIKFNKNYAEAYLNMGILYVNMNNMYDACIQFENAHQKGSPSAINFLNNYCNR